MLTQQQATDFAEEWVAAWNEHDIDAIMSHYAEEIEFTSPFVMAINGNATGTINDKKELQQYFERALLKFPDLHFELQTLLTGVQSVVLYYKSVNSLLAAEYMQLNDKGKVTVVNAHYLKVE